MIELHGGVCHRTSVQCKKQHDVIGKKTRISPRYLVRCCDIFGIKEEKLTKKVPPKTMAKPAMITIQINKLKTKKRTRKDKTEMDCSEMQR